MSEKVSDISVESERVSDISVESECHLAVDAVWMVTLCTLSTGQQLSLGTLPKTATHHTHVLGRNNHHGRKEVFSSQSSTSFCSRPRQMSANVTSEWKRERPAAVPGATQIYQCLRRAPRCSAWPRPPPRPRLPPPYCVRALWSCSAVGGQRHHRCYYRIEVKYRTMRTTRPVFNIPGRRRCRRPWL